MSLAIDGFILYSLLVGINILVKRSRKAKATQYDMDYLNNPYFN